MPTITERKVSPHYLDGIREGREMLNMQGADVAHDELANLKATIKRFGAETSTGQFLRGARDFWTYQIKAKQ